MTRIDPTVPRPDAEEYAPFYNRYVELVPVGDIATLLADQSRATTALLTRNADRSDYSYAEGKWTVKQVVGHLADSERVFAYRALRFARGDATDLPGFDENAFVDGGDFNRRGMADMIEELASVRAATLTLIGGFSQEAYLRRGTANGAEISVRALLYITAGHERHHLELLRTRYGLAG
jgi:hypothetical protein